MSTVAKHLAYSYRWVYGIFMSIMILVMAGLALSFEVFGHYTLDDQRSSVWETVGLQAPRWFMFVIGIMLATVNLPVLVAHGITRRVFARGALVFAVASSAAFSLLMLMGFVVERAVYTANGMMAAIDNYPLAKVTDASRFYVEITLAGLLFMLSGWVIGLLFYRLRIWLALLALPVVTLPVIGGIAMGMSTIAGVRMSFANVVLIQLAAVLIVIALGYFLGRDVAIKPKKA